MKTLRIGCAMGGGSSLGSFSGGALTEAIKLSIVYAYLKEKEKVEAGKDAEYEYDDIVLDCAFGASAGAITLGLMIRILADPDPEKFEQAAKKLRDQNNADYTQMENNSKRPHFWGKLVAMEMVQEAQRDVWTQRTAIRNLLSGKAGTSADPKTLKHQPSLLNRGVVDEIAKDYIALKPETKDFARRALLAPRVLYGCTLSCLVPMDWDSKLLKNPPKAAAMGLTDVKRNRVHREERVFDLFFKHRENDDEEHKDNPSCSYQYDPTKENIQKEANAPSHTFPSRWFRLIEGKEDVGFRGSLLKQSSWEKIAASGLASGAFPVAFEPVLLKRYPWEYPKHVQIKIFGDEKQRIFPYIDGGTFNNEPLREAFKLANFMDSLADPNEKFERWMLFVDPWVDIEATNMNAGHLAEFAGTKRRVYRKSSLDRLIPWISNVGVALRNQAKVNEGEKALAVRHTFTVRNLIRKNILAKYFPVVPGCLTVDADMVLDLRDRCLGLFKDNESLLPTSTLSLVSEMMRVGHEEDAQNQGLAFPREFCRAFSSVTQGKLDALLGKYSLNLAQVQTVLEWAYLDAGFDLSGKSEMALPLVITPQNLAANGSVSLTVIGHYFNAFAGFMSHEVSSHDFEVGRMKATERINAFTSQIFAVILENSLTPKELGVLTASMQRDIRAGRDLLADRFVEMAKASEAAPWFKQVAGVSFKGLIGLFLKRAHPFEKKRSIELLVPVSWNSGYRFHAGWLDFSRRATFVLNRNRDQKAFPFHMVAVCQEIRTDSFTPGGNKTVRWDKYGIRERDKNYFLVLRRDNQEPATIEIPMPDMSIIDKIPGYVAPVLLWDWKKGHIDENIVGEWSVCEGHLRPTLEGSF